MVCVSAMGCSYLKRLDDTSPIVEPRADASSAGPPDAGNADRADGYSPSDLDPVDTNGGGESIVRDATADHMSADVSTSLDSGRDAASPLGCGASGDYVETLESSSKGFSITDNGQKLVGSGGESTGFVLDTGWKTRVIGGCESLEERGMFLTLATWDTDVYAFDVTTPITVGFNIEWTGTLGRALFLYHAGDGVLLDYREGDTTFDIPPLDLSPGSYYLMMVVQAPSAGQAPPPNSPPVPYRIVLTRFAGSCKLPAAAGTGDYREKDETSVGNRANDVYAVTYNPDIKIVETTTADAAEVTGLVVNAGPRLVIRGRSAQVTGTDAYLDRDTFEFQTGNSVTTVYARTNWAPATGDMDIMFVRFDGVDPVILPWATPGTAPEEHGFTVQPNTRYQIWIGQFADGAPGALDYAIALCGNN